MAAPVIRTTRIQKEVYVAFKDLIIALEQEKGVNPSVTKKLWRTLEHYDRTKSSK